MAGLNLVSYFRNSEEPEVLAVLEGKWPYWRKVRHWRAVD